MKTIFTSLILLITLLLSASITFAQSSAFTYQGKLTDGGSNANGQYDFTFRLFTSVSGGSQVGTDVTVDDVQVTAGIFTVNLNFGASPFTSATGNFLEISVRPGANTGAYTPLLPLQPLTSSPFSVRTLNAGSADALSAACVSCVTDSHIISIDGNKVTGTVANAANAGTATTAGNLTGVVQIANGGTGSTTKTFVDTTTSQFINGDKTFLGNVNTLLGSRFNGDGRGLTNVPGTLRWQAVFGTSEQAQANNGYMAAAPTRVTITLPPSSSLNLGDTVRVSGGGDGGWKIAQNADQVVFGANLVVGGVTWIPRDSSRNWKSVASSADGSKLAAVMTANGNIYTSTDFGVTWIPRESLRNWYSIASSADGSKLVAVNAGINNAGGQIYTSVDSGVTWTPRESNRNWNSVTSSADGSKLVAVDAGNAFGGGGQIYTSADSGVTWTPRESNRIWISVASSADGGKLVATTNNGQIYTSADSGVSWTPRETNRRWRSVASSADGSKLVTVVQDGQIYTSTDSGVTWTPRDTNRVWLSVASSADGRKLVAGDYGGKIYTSPDSGLTWTPMDSDRQWTSFASSADGSKLVACVSFGQIYTYSPNTTPGAAGYLLGGHLTSIELQYIGNGQFYPISHEGTIIGF